jgi:hypothetical protein
MSKLLNVSQRNVFMNSKKIIARRKDWKVMNGFRQTFKTLINNTEITTSINVG